MVNPLIASPLSSRTAVIGAGMAGLTCATSLRAAGHAVVVLDKARGPGGRMSTRRQTLEAGDVTFDHGAPGFTVTGADFKARVDTWRLQGLVAAWSGAGPGTFVGVPAMNAPLKAMAGGLEVHWGQAVTQIVRVANGWRLDGSPLADEVFHRVVVAIPAEQAAVLLAEPLADVAALAKASPSTPCWSLMVVFAAPVTGSLSVLEGEGPAVWAGRETSKPGRTGPEAWTIQASPDWSREHLELSPEEAAPHLLQGFQAALGGPLPPVVSAVAHRWRYARPGGPVRDPVWDPSRGLGVCGDWLGGGSVEGAWRSGRQLARLMTQA